MMSTNPQEEFWAGKEGEAYLKRNLSHLPGDGLRRRAPFFDLFDHIGNKDISILEVGCNCGLNLAILQERGYTNLTGIDIGAAAVGAAKQKIPSARILEGSILQLPFEDGEFDVVFSSGVLIHQNPAHALFQAMDEMYRCSSRYILGLEDFSDEMQNITYRNKQDFCWRGPYSHFWQDPGAYEWTDQHYRGFIPVDGHNWVREYYKFEKKNSDNK